MKRRNATSSDATIVLIGDCEAEIHERNTALCIDEDVAIVYVAMKHTGIVQVSICFRNRDTQREQSWPCRLPSGLLA